MQVRDSDTLLLYGLFQSICGWALEKGYRDITTMKHLLKLAMIDVCRQKYEDKPPSAVQMSVVEDLGISLRNVQYSLKSLQKLNDLTDSFVKIRQIRRELLTLLSQKPQSLDDLFPEVSHFIHAPYELQKRTLRTILRDLEQKGFIRAQIEEGTMKYRAVEAHVSLFDPTDISARLSGLLSHIDAFRNTVGEPFYGVFPLSVKQAKGLQTALHELLLGTGNAHEHECRESGAATSPYYYYLGCTVVNREHPPTCTADAMLEVIQARFKDADSPSIARTHWYHLSPAFAKEVYAEVVEFLKGEIAAMKGKLPVEETVPFAFYFGMAVRSTGSSNEGTKS